MAAGSPEAEFKPRAHAEHDIRRPRSHIEGIESAFRPGVLRRTLLLYCREIHIGLTQTNWPFACSPRT